jgi:hypothetical protein
MLLMPGFLFMCLKWAVNLILQNIISGHILPMGETSIFPTKGIIFSSGEHKVKVEVDVIPSYN